MRAQSGEEILFHGHPSWRGMVGFHVKGIVAAVFAGAVVGIATRLAGGQVSTVWVILAVVVVFVLSIALGVLRRLATTYMVTDRRLLIERGLLTRNAQETRLERVQNVASRQTMRERMLRVGTIHFDTAAGADYDFSFYGVNRPRQVVQTVDRALQAAERAAPSL